MEAYVSYMQLNIRASFLLWEAAVPSTLCTMDASAAFPGWQPFSRLATVDPLCLLGPHSPASPTTNSLSFCGTRAVPWGVWGSRGQRMISASSQHFVCVPKRHAHLQMSYGNYSLNYGKSVFVFFQVLCSRIQAVIGKREENETVTNIYGITLLSEKLCAGRPPSPPTQRCRCSWLPMPSSTSALDMLACIWSQWQKACFLFQETLRAMQISLWQPVPRAYQNNHRHFEHRFTLVTPRFPLILWTLKFGEAPVRKN